MGDFDPCRHEEGPSVVGRGEEAYCLPLVFSKTPAARDGDFGGDYLTEVGYFVVNLYIYNEPYIHDGNRKDKPLDIL
jgi:hypothetical protein